MNYFIIVLLSFLATIEPETEVLSHNKNIIGEEEIILKAIELDNDIQNSFQYEKAIKEAINLDRKIHENSKLYTDSELKRMTYDELLSLDDKYIYERLSLYKNIKEQKRELELLAKAIAKSKNIPTKLFISLIEVESNFNKNATSIDGAKGLCQIMPFNFKDLNIEDPFDPLQNMRGGAEYLKNMLELHKGDVQLALASYNAGPSCVIENNNKIPPYKETIEYIKKIVEKIKKKG